MKFIFMILFTSTLGHSQVEDFGKKGLLGRTDYLDKVESFLGSESKCVEASKGEYVLVDDCIQNYTVMNSQVHKVFDPLIEELVFLEAARRSHHISICQTKLHDSIDKDASKQAELVQNAFNQFKHVRATKKSEIATLKEAEINLSVMNGAGINFAEDRGTPNGHRLQKDKALAKEIASAALARAEDIVASIPFGNRPLMRKKLIELLKSEEDVSENHFRRSYNKVLEEIGTEVRAANDFMSSLQTPSFDKKGMIYNLNEDMKKALVRSGQIDNTIAGLNLTTQLSSSFMCRARARYDAGPRTLRLIEIPTYLLGTYGLGRLAISAGVKAIRVTSAAAAYSARAQATAASLAVLGLESYEWSRVADTVRESCIPQNFLLGKSDETCSSESEVQGVYQEAFSAGCIVNGVATIAPPLIVNGIRIGQKLSLIQTKVVAPTAAIANNVKGIVVTGAKPVISKYREARFALDVKRYSTALKRRHPNSSADDILAKAQAAAKARSQRSMELRKSCMSAKPNAETMKAAKIFTSYSVAFGVGNTALSYSLANWNRVKDLEWASNLGFEMVMAYFTSKWGARVSASATMGFKEKILKGNMVAFRNNLIDAGVYSLFFSHDNEKALVEFDRLAKSPTFQQDLDKLIDFTEDESKINEMVDKVGDMSNNVFRIITGNEVVKDLSAEELSNLSAERMKDPAVQEQLMDLILDKTHSDSVDDITSGNKSLDRLAYNTTWNVGSVPLNMLLGAMTFQAVCWNSHSPAMALAAFSALQVGRQNSIGYFYYRTRQKVIHQ